jgi:hypothetical protein
MVARNQRVLRCLVGIPESSAAKVSSWRGFMVKGFVEEGRLVMTGLVDHG